MGGPGRTGVEGPYLQQLPAGDQFQAPGHARCAKLVGCRGYALPLPRISLWRGLRPRLWIGSCLRDPNGAASDYGWRGLVRRSLGHGRLAQDQVPTKLANDRTGSFSAGGASSRPRRRAFAPALAVSLLAQAKWGSEVAGQADVRHPRRNRPQVPLADAIIARAGPRSGTGGRPRSPDLSGGTAWTAPWRSERPCWLSARRRQSR